MSDKHSKPSVERIQKIERHYMFVRDLLFTVNRLKSQTAHASPNVSHGIMLAVKDIQQIIDEHVE